MAETSCSDYLAEEIIFKILSWVPLISILRFKSVCKSWVSIISNPQFIQTHLTNSKTKQPSVLRDSILLSNNEVYINDAVYIDTRDDSIKLHLPIYFSGMNRLIRSCNGLVCVANIYCDVIYVWNPLTKLFKTLPTPNKQSYPFEIDLGFGFDSISNDYKLLRIVFDDSVIYILEAELYSANADSWKDIQFPDIVQGFRHYAYSHCVHAKNGVLYLEGINELLSFDLHNEVFGVFPFPNNMQHDRKSNILDFKGSVAMIFESIGDGSVLGLWTLDQDCGKGSWTENFNIEADLKIDWVALYLGVGQFVVVNYDVGYMFYDHKKKETKNFSPPVPFRDVTSVVKYTESLVSLKGFEQLE